MKRRKKSPLTAYCCRENKFIMIDQPFPTTINMPNMINTLDSFMKHECRKVKECIQFSLHFVLGLSLLQYTRINTLQFK
jgi:hypothetical protein